MTKIELAQKSTAIIYDHDLKLSIAYNMEEYGGSFVKALGKCLRVSDQFNTSKLVAAFIEYMIDYLPEKWEKKYYDKKTETRFT